MDSLHLAGGADQCSVVEAAERLRGFRTQFYLCLQRRADELFELTEALLCADGPVSTLVGLCLTPEHRRGHGALYDAVNVGRVDVERLGRALGRKLERAAGTPVEGATEPAAGTPEDVARAQQQLKITQWVIPALTGGIAVLNAIHGEQQRPQQQVPGILAKPARLFGVA